MLLTDALQQRATRPPDYEIESRALAVLVQALADSPGTILQSLADTILGVCQADSAGISLLTADKTRFHWAAIAGRWQPHVGGGTPRDFGPCGDVLDRRTPLLFTHFERRYPYFLPTTPAAEECLLVPFYEEGKATGTIWAIIHDDRRTFDAEDLRLLESLGRFASAANQAVKAQVELRTSERRYRSLFDSIDEGFCIIERVGGEAGAPLDFRYVEANAAFETQSGISGVLGKTIRQLGIGDMEVRLRIYDAVCRTGEPIRFERELFRVGRFLEVYAFQVDDGTHARVAVIFRDITARKKTESAMRVSEMRYRRLFESATDGILILGAADGRVVYANPFVHDLVGASTAGLAGKELWELGLVADKSQNEAAVRALQQEGHFRCEQLLVQPGTGHHIEVELVANAYQEGDSRVIQCNIRDVTERNRLERKTHEQAEALANLHLRKDEFLAMLSHELRTPLAAISNAVQLLRLQTDDEERAAARGIIERKMGHLRHLVDDLLEVSRITTGRVQLRQERITASAIVQRAVETVRPLIEQRGHDLRVELPEQPIWLMADAARLEQVIVNLLTNAAKYTEAGGHIWLGVQREGDAAVLRVRDTGVGIAPELLPHIFDLFTQAERSLDRSEGGLGVGLSLVQRMVELHGGTVAVSSILGEGSEFVVRLPVAEPLIAPMPDTLTPPASVPATNTAQAVQAGQAIGTTRKVLIVDDDEDTAEGLAKLLQASGHDVRMAYDGPAAVQAALDYRPDVMLLDIGLPMLNGFEVAERLREQGALESIVLVAVTGYGQEKDRQKTRAAGFDHHLVKPAEFGEVQRILSAVGKARA